MSDLVEALESQEDEERAFLDLETGEIHVLPVEILSQAEEAEDDGEPADNPEFELAVQIVSTPRYKRLPRKFEVHDWQIMRDFAESVESARIREELLDAVHGAGAFRAFKSAIRGNGIEAQWNAFRADALREIALRWCEENKIEWK